MEPGHCRLKKKKKDNQVSVIIYDEITTFLWGFLKGRLTLCPWRERRLRAGEGAGRCGPGCSQRPGGAASTVREDGLLGRTGRWLAQCVLPSVATRSKRLIRARSIVLRQAMLGELQMNGEYDDARSMEFGGGVIQRQKKLICV